MFGFPKWIIAGSIGGAIGAAIWATITYFANAEVGFVAWGIGFVVGFFVRVAAGENETGLAPGLTAALVAIAAVLGGKYAAVHMLVAKELAAGGPDISITADEMIVDRADEIIKLREAKGQKVVFPGGKTIEMATEEADYPPDVWREATAQWNKLPKAEQEKQMDETKERQQALFKALGGAVREQAFLASFSLFDLLWFFLAAGTAYRLGSGEGGSDD